MRKLITLLCLFSAIAVQAQVPTQQPNTYVHDYLNVLTPEQKLSLNRHIKKIDTTSKVQICIVLAPELPGKYAVIEEFARAIGKEWKVGNAQNGIVYVLTMNPKKTWISTAKRIQGNLPDITAKHIQEDMRPYLKERDFYGALDVLVSEIEDKIDVKEQKQNLVQLKKDKSDDNNSGWLIFILLAICGGGIFFLVYSMNRSNRKAKEAAEDYARRYNSQYKDLRHKDLQNFQAQPRYERNTPKPPIKTIDTSKPKKEREEEEIYVPIFLTPNRNSDDEDSTKNEEFGNFGDDSPTDDVDFDGGGSGGDFD